ncbi:MAG: imidazole glycerol phosphate synthase subunit HisH [Lachnospiraceae bacterium]|nr:imidazole glycerol phosphate synthase subunit HisH [Lachnospiraceae bacterium]
MIAVIDYDAGNIKSVEHAFRYIGEDVTITRDPVMIRNADHIVLPGVGSFGDAMEKLHRYDLVDPIRETAEKGVPFLGICLGEQLLFESSEESPGVPGLGILKGRVLRFPDQSGYKIPQIGWNSLKLMNGGRLLRNLQDGAYVYFVHSFYVHAQDRSIVKAVCSYTAEADAAVENGNIAACQFHPEKSGDIGLAILKNFVNMH